MKHKELRKEILKIIWYDNQKTEDIMLLIEKHERDIRRKYFFKSVNKAL